MNATIASNINGGVNIQEMASGSHSSLLLSSIEFTLTEIKTNCSTTPQEEGEGKKYFTQLMGGTMAFNGQAQVIQNSSKAGCNIHLAEQQNGRIVSIENYTSVQPLNGNLFIKNNSNNSVPAIDPSPAKSVSSESSEATIPAPRVELYTGRIRTEWDCVRGIGAGLQNLGNSCFMNTVMQCLTYCPPLANYLLNDNDHPNKCTKGTIAGFCMMCLLQEHMKRTIGRSGEVVKPLNVHHHLRSIAKHFVHGRQEDAHEFLRYVIDHLWKSCLPNGATKLDSASKETTVINKIFGGYHRSQVICLKCKTKSNTYDHFMDFILDIKQNVMSLEKALEKFTQPEILQQENCYCCPQCKVRVEAQKRFSVYRAPAVATFQFKRFDYNRSFGGKITKQITYPEKLNLRPYMSETKGNPVWYRLNAVLVHSGPTCNSGHYFCYVRNSNGLWYIMDDQRVHQVSLNQVLNQSAYVLFYVKIENSNKAVLKKYLDTKATFLKGTTANSHFSTISKVDHLKSFNEKNQPSFSGSKINSSSPIAIKKPLNVITSNFSQFPQESSKKVSYGNFSTMQLKDNSAKLAAHVLKPLSSSNTGLVPYVEDSSQSSSDDAGENRAAVTSEYDCPDHIHSEQNSNAVIKYTSINNSISCLNISTKPSKSILKTRTATLSIPKVSATGSWIVTDAPQTVLSPSIPCSATRVTSTTDWHVIDTDESLNSPPSNELNLDQNFKTNHDRRNNASLKNSSFQKETGIAKHYSNVLDDTKIDPLTDNSLVKETEELKQNFEVFNSQDNGYKSSNSPFQFTNAAKQNRLEPGNSSFAQKYHFQNRDCEESSVKRKYSDCEMRQTPVHKKTRYSSTDNNELSLFSSQPKCSLDSRFQNCEDDSPEISEKNGFTNSYSSPILNGTTEKQQKINDFCKEKHSGSSFKSQLKKKKSSLRKNPDSLYGTQIPTWKDKIGDDGRISNLMSEKRRVFDDYDKEYDRGKVRKWKTKDRYFHSKKTSFQRHVDRQMKHLYNGNKFSNISNHKPYGKYPRKYETGSNYYRSSERHYSNARYQNQRRH